MKRIKNKFLALFETADAIEVDGKFERNFCRIVQPMKTKRSLDDYAILHDYEEAPFSLTYRDLDNLTVDDKGIFRSENHIIKFFSVAPMVNP